MTLLTRCLFISHSILRNSALNSSSLLKQRRRQSKKDCIFEESNKHLDVCFGRALEFLWYLSACLRSDSSEPAKIIEKFNQSRLTVWWVLLVCISSQQFCLEELKVEPLWCTKLSSGETWLFDNLDRSAYYLIVNHNMLCIIWIGYILQKILVLWLKGKWLILEVPRLHQSC